MQLSQVEARDQALTSVSLTGRRRFGAARGLEAQVCRWRLYPAPPGPTRFATGANPLRVNAPWGRGPY